MTALNKKLYHYTARELNGRKIKGDVWAADQNEVYQQLAQQKYFVISSRPTSNLHLKFMTNRSSIVNQELVDFCLHMHFMDQAGVPLLDALIDAQENTKHLTPHLQQMVIEIREGKTLSEAMKIHKKVFPPLFSQIIHLSEQTGQLHTGFKKIYDHLLWTTENKKLFVKGIQYPFLVFGLVCICIWMMTTFVIPQMQDLTTMSGAEIPASSQWLLSINTLLISGFPRLFVILCIIALFLLGLRLLSNDQRLKQDRWALKIPLLGRLLLNRDISLYLHYFHVCVASHMDLIEALDHSRNIVKNHWMAKKLGECIESVQEGKTLSEAFKHSTVLNASGIRLIQVGELTGQLLPLLAILENYAQRDLKKQMEQFIQYLQPALLGVMGLLLIWIVLGIFYPIYDQLLLMED